MNALGSALPCPVTVDRRTTPRHRILQRCFVRPERVPGDGGWPCIAYDLSAQGIGLTLPCPLPEGTILRVEPWGLRGASVLLARVVRTAPVAFTWFAGCELLAPIGEKDLRLWLASPRDWLPDDSHSPTSPDGVLRAAIGYSG